MYFEEFDEFTRKLCTETEKIILRYFDNPNLEIDNKSDDTPVTIADRECEKNIRDAISIVYPDHGIIGEEYGETNPESEYVWVLDPIDGTKTFITGCPLYGTMIALLKNGEPIFGCVNYPSSAKRISGDGKRAFCNKKRIAARSGQALKDSILLTTDFLAVSEYQDPAGFETLARQVNFCRTWGDCYGYLLLCEGKADMMLDPVLNPWDLMALIPIIRGAGATVTDWQGNDPAKGNSLVAANSDLHESILQILNP